MTDMTREQALKNMQETLNWAVTDITAESTLQIAARWAQIAEALRTEPATYGKAGGPPR